MKTKIKNRKTPHAVTNTLYGTVGVEYHLAWCFMIEEDQDGPLVKKYIPWTNSYCKPKTQDIPDHCFSVREMRKYHVDVWNQKCKNYEKHGIFVTNFEYNQTFGGNNLMPFFE